MYTMDNINTMDNVENVESVEGMALEGESVRRKFFFYFFLAVVFVFFFIVNFLPYDPDNLTLNLNLINSYYHGTYQLCLHNTNTNNSVNNINSGNSGNSVNSGNNVNNEENCVIGEMELIVVLKDVNLDGFYRIYVGIVLEPHYQGKWYQFWKSKHFFSSTHKHSHIILSLSNLIHLSNSVNVNSVGSVNSVNSVNSVREGENWYLNDFVPNFINTKNLHINNGKGGLSVVSNDKLLNSIRLNTWNQFSHLGNIHNFNLSLTLSQGIITNTVNSTVGTTEDPESPTDTVNTMNTMNTMNSVNSVNSVNNVKISSREMDELYLINMRRYVQNEFEHIANFDISLYNPFSVFNTHNFFNTNSAPNLINNQDDITTILNITKGNYLLIIYCSNSIVSG
eukprot:XP_763755.1 hypothetical protein [Theileria parva strain Muguga]